MQLMKAGKMLKLIFLSQGGTVGYVPMAGACLKLLGIKYYSESREGFQLNVFGFIMVG
jgi:hypothetical protein